MTLAVSKVLTLSLSSGCIRSSSAAFVRLRAVCRSLVVGVAVLAFLAATVLSAGSRLAPGESGLLTSLSDAIAALASDVPSSDADPVSGASPGGAEQEAEPQDSDTEEPMLATAQLLLGAGRVGLVPFHEQAPPEGLFSSPLPRPVEAV